MTTPPAEERPPDEQSAKGSASEAKGNNEEEQGDADDDDDEEDDGDTLKDFPGRHVPEHCGDEDCMVSVIVSCLAEIACTPMFVIVLLFFASTAQERFLP